MKKLSLLRVEIKDMDCPVERGEIERLFEKDSDFRVKGSNLTERTMTFEVQSEAAEIETLLSKLKKAGFPGTVLSEGESEEFTLYIEDMDCPVERAEIEAAFEKDPLFTATKFDMSHREVTFRAKSEGATLDALTKKLNSIDLPGTPVTKVLEKKTPTETKPKSSFCWHLLIALIFAAASEIAEITGAAPEILIITLAIIAIGLSGLKTLVKGAKNLFHLTFNMNTLMAVAVFGAVAIGQYPEAAMVMVLYEIGEEIEDHTLASAQKSIQTLLEKAPSSVEILVGSSWVKSDAKRIVKGTLYRTMPGQMIVADGTVTEGVSSIDTASITGESIPESATPGSTVRSGCIALDGTLTIRASHAASDSTAARIARAIVSASEQKAKIERLVDKFARYYTPSIFAASLLLAIGTVLYTGTLDKETIYRSLVLLVIGCPCALVISTPVALLSAMTSASRNGVFVRGGVPMETAAALKTAVFDKTGTLTVGKPAFRSLAVFSETDEKTAWTLAGALASANKHPLSQALARACDKTLTPPPVKGLKNLPGYGVEGRIQGALLRLTNRRWLEENKLLGEEPRAVFEQMESLGNTTLALSDLFGVRAIFSFSDTPKENIAESIRKLTSEGVSVWLLTGDNEKSAQAIANIAGIKNVRARLLPEDKLKKISELDAISPTAMIGDGINDAPALARSRLGVAMGSLGSDTAIESADVVLMNDDIAKIAWLKRLSQATRRCIKQNIAFALGVKALFAIAAVSGFATMWMAVFADTGVCLIVVAWALRLLKFPQS